MLPPNLDTNEKRELFRNYVKSRIGRGKLSITKGRGTASLWTDIKPRYDLTEEDRGILRELGLITQGGQLRDTLSSDDLDHYLDRLGLHGEANRLARRKARKPLENPVWGEGDHVKYRAQMWRVLDVLDDGYLLEQPTGRRVFVPTEQREAVTDREGRRPRVEAPERPHTVRAWWDEGRGTGAYGYEVLGPDGRPVRRGKVEYGETPASRRSRSG